MSMCKPLENSSYEYSFMMSADIVSEDLTVNDELPISSCFLQDIGATAFAKNRSGRLSEEDDVERLTTTLIELGAGSLSRQIPWTEGLTTIWNAGHNTKHLSQLQIPRGYTGP